MKVALLAHKSAEEFLQVHKPKNKSESSSEEDRSPGMVVIVRNNNAAMIAGHSGVALTRSPLEAELIAICDGLLLLSNLNPCPVVFASDSQILINAMISRTPPSDWRVANLFAQARYLSSTRQISWLWTSRKANRAADHFDALALSDSCPSDWVSNPPSSLMNILVYDGLPCPH
ncbi:PREDICTED: uncharacterized protein LOC101303385 [Fragaria vesca subsp. vesca]